jgi:7-keto-8-aminopelargonate synthetase-like enzyme
VIVDEAHATGVFGAGGRGVEELLGLTGRMDVQMGTFGKALGSYGAFALGDAVTIDYLVNRARTFMYTTALPASSLAASSAALRLITESTAFRNDLWEKIAYMRQHLLHLGFDLKQSQGPIIPIVVGEDSKTVHMQRLLMDRGVFLQAIRPPTVPPGTSRLRLTVVRGLSEADMDEALDALQWAGKEVGLI